MKQTLTFDANEVMAIIMDHVAASRDAKAGDMKATIEINIGTPDSLPSFSGVVVDITP